MKKDPKQKEEKSLEILTAIRNYWRENNTSPSIREIGEAAGISSSSHVDYCLNKLERQKMIIRKLIERKDKKPHRKIFLHPLELAKNPLDPKERTNVKAVDNKGIVSILDFGPIAAGYQLQLSDASFSMTMKPEPDQSVVQIPESYIPSGVKLSEVFALHVEGNSMRDAMLIDGDIVILQKISIDRVKNGDIVAAWLIENQAPTLKRFEWGKRTIILRPENPSFKTLHLHKDEVEIQGKLLAVLRFAQSVPFRSTRK